MENILEVSGLTKDYGEFKLEDVSFCVPKGTVVGFIGENGAGKTTTIKLILDIIKRDLGNIKIFNKDNNLIDEANREDIGIVLDNCCFQENLKVKDINKIMKNIYGKWNEEKFFFYVKELKIPKENCIKEFSKGNKMKLSLAVAFSHDPKLLILDEATSGLDPVIRDRILDFILEFIQDEDKAVLMSSHIVSDLEKVCDYITFIHKGKIILNEEKDRLKDRYGIFNGSKKEFDKMPKDRVIKKFESEFGVKALVLKEKFDEIKLDKASIEDIMLYYIK